MNCLDYSNKLCKFITILASIFLFVNFVYAQDRVLNLVFIKDEVGIRLMDRTVSTSKIESEGANLSGYKFIIKDFNEGVVETLNFGFKDNVAILPIPISPRILRGEIYDEEDNFILDIDLYSHVDLGLCGDNACSGDETYETCPGDCFFQRETLFLEQENKKENGMLSVILYSGAGIILVIALIFSVILLKNKLKFKEKIIYPNVKTELSLEQQLQRYIQNALEQGLSKEEIRNQLIEAGWPLDLIEKNLK